ncbi:MAG TPA: hypothetical protein VN659_06920 [Pyrinomonadaceae bacterium]|nr:hypothetical protein [Pyrinomonadaceae bacterium]
MTRARTFPDCLSRVVFLTYDLQAQFGIYLGMTPLKPFDPLTNYISFVFDFGVALT